MRSTRRDRPHVRYERRAADGGAHGLAVCTRIHRPRGASAPDGVDSSTPGDHIASDGPPPRGRRCTTPVRATSTERRRAERRRVRRDDLRRARGICRHGVSQSASAAQAPRGDPPARGVERPSGARRCRRRRPPTGFRSPAPTNRTLRRRGGRRGRAMPAEPPTTLVAPQVGERKRRSSAPGSVTPARPGPCGTGGPRARRAGPRDAAPDHHQGGQGRRALRSPWRDRGRPSVEGDEDDGEARDQDVGWAVAAAQRPGAAGSPGRPLPDVRPRASRTPPRSRCSRAGRWSSTTCRGRPTTPPRSTATSTGAGSRTSSRAWRRRSSTSAPPRTRCSTAVTCATTSKTSRRPRAPRRASRRCCARARSSCARSRRTRSERRGRASPRRSRSRGGSWSWSPTPPRSASPSGSTTTSASGCAGSSTRSARPATA